MELHEKYGLNTQFVISGLMVAGDIYSANYSNLNNELKGTHINLETGGFEMADGKLIYDAKTQKLSLKNVELSINFNNEEKDITDIVGDTIVSQTMHYLVSDKSEGITIESQGWTTDIQYVSNEKRYLWIYITNTKSNGDTGKYVSYNLWCIWQRWRKKVNKVFKGILVRHILHG